MSDPLAPFAGEHEGHIYAAVGGPPYHWRFVCLCGFVGPQHDSPGAAAADLIGHRPQETP